MTVTVRCFAALRELVGWSSRSMSLEAGATVGSLLDRLGEEHAGIADYRGRMLTAVNREYAREEARLRDGDEVALLPPVSGG